MYLAIKQRTTETDQSLNFDQYQVEFAIIKYVLLIIHGKSVQPTLVSIHSSDYEELTIFKLIPVIHQVISQHILLQVLFSS